MNIEEMKAKFEKNVEYLKNNIPPDDIYVFCEQTYMATLFFLHKWSEWVDINEECRNDPVAQKWVMNIMGLLKARDMELDVDLDLDLKSLEDDEDSD